MTVLVSVCACVAVVCVVVGAVPAPSKEKRTDSGKKLRNVIITSFGEMPYEPMESAGYYQSDIIPVNLNDEIEQQTMDVALRTGILVEDPNEKKTDQEDITDDIEDASLEDEAVSTNTKRQASDETSSEEKTVPEKKEDKFLSPKSRLGHKRSGDYDNPLGVPVKFLSHPLNYNYGIPKHQRGHVIYRLYPAPDDSDGANNNREYFAELGDGWSLQDAEKILKGRNYNILVVTPNQYTYDYPELQSRELPPSIYFSGSHNPLIYSFPNFDYNPGLYPIRRAAPHPHAGSTASGVVRRPEGETSLNSNNKVPSPRLRGPSPLPLQRTDPYAPAGHLPDSRGPSPLPLQRTAPYAPAGHFPEEYLSGA